MSTSTRQKPHRRTMSLSAGSNDSSENLLSIPNQRIVNSNSSNSNNYSSHYLDSISQKSGKSPLSSISESINKISLQNPPSTPSKNKSFGKQMMNNEKSSGIELKSLISMLMFFCALIFFLGSLSGIGPPFGDLDYVVKEEQNQNNIEEINVVQDSNVFNDINDKPDVNEVLEPWEEPFAETLENKIDEKFAQDSVFEDGEDDDDVKPKSTNQEKDETATEQQPLAENLANNIIPEKVVQLPEEKNQPHQEESILEDIKIEPNSNEINFGHSDEILINNGESKNQLKETSNNNTLKNIETEGESKIIGLPNKLNKNKLRHYKSDVSDKSGGLVDYAKYTYQAPKPHFTYEDVIVSLTEVERNEITTTQLTEMNTDESLDSTCGTWQRNYAKLHEDTSTGKVEQRYVSYICEANSNCGGLGDRILGMTSTFLFALLTNRAYLADWQAPLPLDAIFDSPNIDWSYDSLNPDSVIKDLKTSEINVTDFYAQDLDDHFLVSNWSIKYTDPFIKFYTNRGMIIRTFDSKYYAQPLKEIGLRPHTAFGCIFDYLFRPVPPAMSFITKYTSLFSINNIFSVGIQIRTRENTETLQDYKHFFNCADQLTQTYAVPDQKVIYFLITDSEALRNEAVQKLEHVIISGLPIKLHPDHDHADDVNNAVIENWILSKTDYRVISPGGYGKLSAFHSKQLYTTVSMDFPFFDKQIPDCTKEDAFITFSKLASEWSLG